MTGDVPKRDRFSDGIFQQQRGGGDAFSNKGYILFMHLASAFRDLESVGMEVAADGETLFRRVGGKTYGPVDIGYGVERCRDGIIDPADIIAVNGEGAAFGHVIIIIVVPGPAAAKGFILPIVFRQIDRAMGFLQEADDRLVLEIGVEERRVAGALDEQGGIGLPVAHSDERVAEVFQSCV